MTCTPLSFCQAFAAEKPRTVFDTCFHLLHWTNRAPHLQRTFANFTNAFAITDVIDDACDLTRAVQEGHWTKATVAFGSGLNDVAESVSVLKAMGAIDSSKAPLLGPVGDIGAVYAKSMQVFENTKKIIHTNELIGKSNRAQRIAALEEKKNAVLADTAVRIGIMALKVFGLLTFFFAVAVPPTFALSISTLVLIADIASFYFSKNAAHLERTIKYL